jgi:site-specific DNA recombinase
LDQEFNSLDAQYDAASAYIKSQAHAGWTLIRSQREGEAVHLVANQLTDLSADLAGVRDRDNSFTGAATNSNHGSPGIDPRILTI